MIAIIAVILVFIFLGILFFKGKGTYLISGYNTMAKEEKEKYDKIALGKFMGKLMFIAVFCMLFWLCSIIFSIIWLGMVGTILLIGAALFAVAYANSSKHLKKMT